MAATALQGKSFTLFMGAITAAAAGIAYFSTGAGKVALIVGLIALAISALSFIKLKPQEGKTGATSQPAVTKLIGVMVVLGGWLFVLFGLHLTASVGGRMATSILGLCVSLFGIIFILAPAVNKNAIWKVR